ncbi:MAG: DevR family CRISPR-associated autoregulator [Macellibacteroides fermentans]|uniref:DevR family CRISPR-associated autoregulator n=1 Tax=Macellibacteroides fermentans TaxID=879969 RepID=UPI003AC9C7BF
MENNKVASISISGEITLNLHSLNNEGGEGNQIMTRQLTIIDKMGNAHTVNGISGDMFKHIHVGHLVNYSLDNGLALSDYSKRLDPNRISSANLLEKFPKVGNKESNSAEVIDAIIKTCTVCDAHGVLITDKIGENKSSSNTPRKSVIEFGWTVGIPGKNNTETYVHTKLVSDAGEKGSGTGSNEGQNIFHRPANHGVYAFICNIDTYRIGLNDISRKYSIEDSERDDRYKAILGSLLCSFLNPKGAMTSTQKPHITDFKGVVSVSYKLIPAPTVSAINPDYKKEMVEIMNSINSMETDSVETIEFNGLGSLSKIIAELITKEPYKIK